ANDAAQAIMARRSYVATAYVKSHRVSSAILDAAVVPMILAALPTILATKDTAARRIVWPVRSLVLVSRADAIRAFGAWMAPYASAIKVMKVVRASTIIAATPDFDATSIFRFADAAKSGPRVATARKTIHAAQVWPAAPVDVCRVPSSRPPTLSVTRLAQPISRPTVETSAFAIQTA
ncbi:MAG: hypothetical protein AAFN74_27230, partial [Myxococcota bacterium]